MRVDNLTNFTAKLEVSVTAGFDEENPQTAGRAFGSIVERFRALLQTASGTLRHQDDVSSLPVSTAKPGTPISLPPKQGMPAWGIPFTPTPGGQEVSTFITLENWNPKTGKSSSYMAPTQLEAAVALEGPLESPGDTLNTEESSVESGVRILPSEQSIPVRPVNASVDGYARFVGVIPGDADSITEGALATFRQGLRNSVGSHDGNLDVKTQAARAEAREQKKKEECLWAGVAIALDSNAEVSKLAPRYKGETSRMLEISTEAVPVPSADAGLFSLAQTPGMLPPRRSPEQADLPANASGNDEIAGIIAAPDVTQANGSTSNAGASSAPEREAKQFPGSSGESFPIETNGKQPTSSPIEHQARTPDSALPGSQSAGVSRGSSSSFEPWLDLASELEKLSGEPIVTELPQHPFASSHPGKSSVTEARFKGDTNGTSNDWGRGMFAGPMGSREEMAPASKFDGAEQGHASSHYKQNRADTPTMGPGVTPVTEAQETIARQETGRGMANKAFQWNNIPSAAHTPQTGDGGTPLMQQAPPSTATNTPEFIMQLGDRIRVQVQRGDGEIRLQLRPENLGHLDIKAENGSVGLVARIATESGSVKHYLESNLHVLQQSMLEQGLKVERIEVVLQDGLEARNFAHQQNSHQTGQQREEPRHLPDSLPAAGMPNTESTASDPGNISHIHHHRGFHTVA